MNLFKYSLDKKVNILEYTNTFNAIECFFHISSIFPLVVSFKRGPCPALFFAHREVGKEREQGAEALPTGKAKIVPGKLFAFPPVASDIPVSRDTCKSYTSSLAVMGKGRVHMSMDGR